mmetsp:Transcript_51931/g.137351  ORF Transcript_51931/g.137351 Transcript_51931/m.137351 type:complete len:387 (+) Transcript_51931:261-1421(+)
MNLAPKGHPLHEWVQRTAGRRRRRIWPRALLPCRWGRRLTCPHRVVSARAAPGVLRLRCWLWRTHRHPKRSLSGFRHRSPLRARVQLLRTCWRRRTARSRRRLMRLRSPPSPKTKSSATSISPSPKAPARPPRTPPAKTGTQGATPPPPPAPSSPPPTSWRTRRAPGRPRFPLGRTTRTATSPVRSAPGASAPCRCSGARPRAPRAQGWSTPSVRRGWRRGRNPPGRTGRRPDWRGPLGSVGLGHCHCFRSLRRPAGRSSARWRAGPRRVSRRRRKTRMLPAPGRGTRRPPRRPRRPRRSRRTRRGRSRRRRRSQRRPRRPHRRPTPQSCRPRRERPSNSPPRPQTQWYPRFPSSRPSLQPARRSPRPARSRRSPPARPRRSRTPR